jgi:hypothetical protein
MSSNADARELRRRFREQHSLITRSQLRLLGVSWDEERRQLERGEWELISPTVLRLAGARWTPEQDLMAACLAGGPTAVASHESAAWLWGIGPQPERHAITLGRAASGRVQGARIHRPKDYPEHVLVRHGIPLTNPLRTLVDLGSVVSGDRLHEALDRALASRLVTVEGVESELLRLGRRGRGGAGRLRLVLMHRGFTGAPHPSVLESQALRLLHEIGVEPIATEVKVGPDQRYRIDILLAPRAVMEVDGRAYHASPEQTRADEQRRAELREDGFVVLVYTWREVVYDRRRVALAVLRTVRQTA